MFPVLKVREIHLYKQNTVSLSCVHVFLQWYTLKSLFNSMQTQIRIFL